MDVRAMQDDAVVVLKEDASPQSAWPAWKHLLEDLAEARPPPSTLKLAYKNLGDAGVIRLAELLRGPLSQVTVLDLSCTSIGSAGASALAASLQENRWLRALDMSSNAATDVGVIALAKSLSGNTTLQSLSLHACLVGDKGASALAEALMSNETLLEVNLRQVCSKPLCSLLHVLCLCDVKQSAARTTSVTAELKRLLLPLQPPAACFECVTFKTIHLALLARTLSTKRTEARRGA